MRWYEIMDFGGVTERKKKKCWADSEQLILLRLAYTTVVELSDGYLHVLPLFTGRGSGDGDGWVFCL
jgi:hypothetical protein